MAEASNSHENRIRELNRDSKIEVFPGFQEWKPIKSTETTYLKEGKNVYWFITRIFNWNTHYCGKSIYCYVGWDIYKWRHLLIRERGGHKNSDFM